MSKCKVWQKHEVMARGERVDLKHNHTWGRWQGKQTLSIGDLVNKLLHKISCCWANDGDKP